MMSKCSNPGSQTTCMQLVWTKWRHFMVYLTTRFYVALCLFRNRSQMMSKCVKNKEVAHEPQTYIYRDLFFFGVTDVFTKFWRLLWSTEQTHDNMESIFFIQWTERKKKKQACLVPLECSMICASSAISLVIHATFPFSASSFFFVLLVNSFSEKFFIAWGGGGDHLRNFLGGDMLLGPGNP